MDKVRRANIDILRIVSMILIMLGHVYVHYIMPNNVEESQTHTFMSYLSIFINFHVDLFVLITVFFGIRDVKRSLVKNILLLSYYSILLNVFFYSIIGYFHPVITFLPVSHGSWWFMTVYIVLLCVSPLFEKFNETSNDKQVTIMMLTALFLNIYLGFFNQVSGIDHMGFDIINFSCVYIVGLYIRRIGLPKLQYIHYKRLKIFFFILILLALQYKAQGWNLPVKLTAYNSPYAILMAVSIFLLFNFLTVPKALTKLIMFFSTSAVSAYLITDLPQFKESTQGLFFVFYNKFCSSSAGIIGIIVIVLILYVLCCIIDKVRKPLTSPIEHYLLNSKFYKTI